MINTKVPLHIVYIFFRYNQIIIQMGRGEWYESYQILINVTIALGFEDFMWNITPIKINESNLKHK